jgi:hypothetical protein
MRENREKLLGFWSELWFIVSVSKLVRGNTVKDGLGFRLKLGLI